MIPIKLTKEEAERVEYLRYNHPDPSIQKRFECIWLKQLNYKNTDIAKIVNIHHDTVTSYIKLYKQGGCEALGKKHYRKPISELTTYAHSIKEDFTNNPPRTISQACTRIEKLTGIKRKPTQVGIFMKKLGFKRLECGYIPGKADSQAQDTFLKKNLTPSLKKRKQENQLWYSWIAPTLCIPYTQGLYGA